MSERFILTGAVTLDAHSAAAFTISGKVGGVVGAPMPDRLYSLAPRAQLATDFDVVGVHDIATVPVKFMDKKNNADCSEPDACRGFFALAGTLEVLEHDPRYRATFTLTDLYRHDDTTNTIGAPFAGTITGCVNANRS